MPPASAFRRLAALGSALAALACGDPGPSFVGEGPIELTCSIPLDDVHRGAVRGSIPALFNPDIGFFGEPGIEYLQPETRVVGFLRDGEPIAIPHNIFWWHEIVNFDTDDGAIAVTHCPLTGSTLAFDREPIADAELDVSGLLYQNNLMMVDLSGDDESFWPQMARGARCGPADGTTLPMVPVWEMSWQAWRDLHPTTRVVSAFTGHLRAYDEYPYDDYDREDNTYTLFPTPGLDDRRPPKELAIGVPDGDGGVVFPFGELDRVGSSAAVAGSTRDGDFVVFWNRSARGAMAYRPVAAGQSLTFRAAAGKVFDEQTDSEWGLDGVAVSGAFAGEALEPVADAFVAFWFAWPIFYPDLDLWSAP